MKLIWCEPIEWHDFSDETPEKHLTEYLVSYFDPVSDEFVVGVGLYDFFEKGWYIEGTQRKPDFISDEMERVTGFAEMPKGYNPREM